MYDIADISLSKEAPRKKTDEARAWKVQYKPSDGSPVSGQIRLIREPEPVLATIQEVEVAKTLAQPRADDAGDKNILSLIWVPSSSGSAELETAAQAWLGGTDEREIVRAGIRTMRIAWTSDRCVINAPVEQLEDAIDAVLRFTMAKRQCNSLETRICNMWADLNSDVPLTHGVKFWRRARRRRINERTERVTRMNAEYLRLSASLEQLDSKLSSSSKRIYAELVLQGTIYDRLEVMEEPIRFAMDHYEIAISRIVDTRNALTDHWLEFIIVVLLAGQVVVEIVNHL